MIAHMLSRRAAPPLLGSDARDPAPCHEAIGQDSAARIRSKACPGSRRHP